VRVRAALTDVDVCHVNSDMWASTANEAFGSFVVSWLDKNWVLQTRVLRCCVVKGRHTAFAIAAFLLQVASDFGLSQKVGVVRTDGASNCVAAGGVLGDVAGQRVHADRICDFPAVGGSSVSAAGVAVDLGNAARRVRLQLMVLGGDCCVARATCLRRLEGGASVTRSPCN